MPHEAFSRVVLTRDHEHLCCDGATITLHAGTYGVILDVYDDGVAYLIEVFKPIEDVVTVMADEIEAVDRAFLRRLNNIAAAVNAGAAIELSGLSDSDLDDALFGDAPK